MSAAAAVASPAKDAPSPPTFQENEAERGFAVSRRALAACPRGATPTSGHVAVTFGIDGATTAVTVLDTAIAGTAFGACVAESFRTVKVPAFRGRPRTLVTSFSRPSS